MKGSRRRQIRTGFTMVELMAVLIILGLLAGVVVKNFVGQTEKAKVTTTKASLRLLASAVNQFYMENNRYPTEDEGLIVLIEAPSDVTNYPPGGYLDTTELPVDGWGHEFVYELYPESGKPFVIKSLGADGLEGGEGYNADLLSTDR
ncbi:MAG TPA: type II secretion system major pseudopilin GspG [Sedimentisphaerales bacterium]|nr:type II secretion system major pseudopilin GspG [Sedimentisphaerales bacterium]HRS10658.1 type II secretion system major pseudopilin GspG [Sedimentisphaerales bacterium]HRV47363.1 type II secretion system major pseudopilin GspG [Sedimentisphaerales bacterium]